MKLLNNDLYWEVDTDDASNYLVVGREWSPEIEAAVLEGKPDSLYLNYTRGWSGGLSFLSRMPYLRRLKVIVETVDSLEPIGTLAKLEYLLLQGNSRIVPDFAGLSCLKECVLDWLPGCESVFQCTSLNHLYLYGYNSENCSRFAGLKRLKSLSLIQCPNLSSIAELVSLAGLEKLTMIKLPKLVEIKAVGQLPELNHLHIQSCKAIYSFDDLVKAKQLKTLCLINQGKVQSLNCLKNCVQLTHLDFTESTCIVDGDLNVLRDLKRLKVVYFQNRKHYSHQVQEF